MRFLIDEMFPHEVAELLGKAGHDAVSVGQLNLRGEADVLILAQAARDDRIVVTENIADFITLLDKRAAAGDPLVPVILAMKRDLPASRGAMIHALVERLVAWSEKNPDPYRHVHWLN